MDVVKIPKQRWRLVSRTSTLWSAARDANRFFRHVIYASRRWGHAYSVVTEIAFRLSMLPVHGEPNYT